MRLSAMKLITWGQAVDQTQHESVVSEKTMTE